MSFDERRLYFKLVWFTLTALTRVLHRNSVASQNDNHFRLALESMKPLNLHYVAISFACYIIPIIFVTAESQKLLPTQQIFNRFDDESLAEVNIPSRAIFKCYTRCTKHWLMFKHFCNGIFTIFMCPLRNRQQFLFLLSC